VADEREIMSEQSNSEFASLGQYTEAFVPTSSNYLLAPILQVAGAIRPGMRVLDVGCGLGWLAAEFARRGCQVVGIDLNDEYLALASKAYPDIRFAHAAANETILETLQEKPFDLVICVEVAEHVYSPEALAAGCFTAVGHGGRFVVSAPYHGYLKNVIIALAGKGDSHYDPLFHGGHIKFFSRKTMTTLLTRTGFRDIQFAGAGRFPYLWKSLVMSGTKP
jgi:2-polyprenyl-3-methyl-5-hydroxy-6-metoxy-1,4-benzoquinol methylase